MAVFGVGVCLLILVACIIINMPLVQSKHGHHPHLEYLDNLEESPPQDLPKHQHDSKNYPDSYGQRERREHPQGSDHSFEIEDFVCRCRKKHHNKHAATGDTMEKLSEDKKQFHEPHNHGNQRFDEPSFDQHKMDLMMEVKEAQKILLCNYTVLSIPDHRGSRVPKDLKHVVCNQIGCQHSDVHSYCCIQTYKDIEVSYGNGNTESMKLFTGCACVFRILENPEELQLPGIDA